MKDCVLVSLPLWCPCCAETGDVSYVHADNAGCDAMFPQSGDSHLGHTWCHSKNVYPLYRSFSCIHTTICCAPLDPAEKLHGLKMWFFFHPLFCYLVVQSRTEHNLGVLSTSNTVHLRDRDIIFFFIHEIGKMLPCKMYYFFLKSYTLIPFNV